MKPIKLLFLFLIIHFAVLAQDDVIINDPVYGGFQLPFTDTLLWGVEGCDGSSIEYYFDFNNDLTDDIKFEIMCYWGGSGSYSYIKVNPLGNFQILLDTTYMASGHYIDENGQVRDTLYHYTIPYKFMDGDTIRLSEYAGVEQYFMDAESYGSDPPLMYILLNPFRNDTAYFALYKINGDQVWIYYLKVHVHFGEKMELLSAYTNDPMLAIAKQEEPCDCIYPNPVVDKVNIRGDFNLINIYSSEGVLVYSGKISQHHFNLDLSWLPAGIYFVRLVNNSGMIVRKIIKQ